MDAVPERLTVGLVQADLRWQDPAANREHLADLMDRVPGCHLYVLPETFTTGFLGDAGTAAETMNGPTVAWLREQSAARNAAVAGSVALDNAAGQRCNRLLFVMPDGTVRHYDKRHRFGYGGEDERYVAGRSHTVVEWLGWRIDLQICYDLRFPVWCRNSRAFDLQLFVANWPAPRVSHWRALLRARAIENQAIVVAVNRVGSDGNGVDYPGCSVVRDGSGERLLELGAREGVAAVDLSLERLREFRDELPFLDDADRFALD
ncbi:MAG: amidohydrolase [Pseudomonadota bacterium]|nr:MAG: amidohydrolase [Pseudomonadota bacterium]